MTEKRKPNIILITCDALRPDYLGFMGYEKNTSPFLDSLARKGVYFTKAFAVGPGSPQSFVGIFTSTYPADYGGFTYIDRPRVLITEELQKYGYKTIGLHSTAYASGYFGYDRGWDIFRYVSHFGVNKVRPGLQRDTWQSKILKKILNIHKFLKEKSKFFDAIFSIAERLFLFARKIVKDTTNFQPYFLTAEEMNKEVKKAIPVPVTKPIFLWVHYMDTHAPFALFARNGRYGWRLKLKYHLSDISSFLIGELKAHKIFKRVHIDVYDESIKYIDSKIQELFNHLKSVRVLTDDSIAIISSDHGEEFYEHGEFGHGPSLFNTAINVPLIFYGPNRIAAGGVENRPVSQIDLPPTMLKFIGAKPPRAFRGVDIFEKKERPVISQEIQSEGRGDLSKLVFYGASVSYKGYKLIRFLKKEMFFSLDDMAEKNDLLLSESAKAAELEKILKPYEVFRPNKSNKR
jgi:arylsulfatase A-like enzyme